MKPRLILRLALVLTSLLFGSVPVARANLGETYDQINARYGQPVKLLHAPDGDTAKSSYEYQFNDRRIYVNFLGGKSVGESIRAGAHELSDETALAIATKISGATNWTEMKRTPDEVIWFGSMTSVSLQHHPDADFVMVISLQLVGHEMQREENSPTPNAPSTASASTDTKVDPATRILNWQQDIAAKGDVYGELQMGLRYRDGNGVEENLDKAREWLQKAADQGDTDAAAALAKLPKPKHGSLPAPTNSVVIDSNLVLISAEFGMGKNVADVTARVAELLQGQPDGFTADAKTLGADPLPGKKKRLVVKYDYQGKQHVLTVQGGKMVDEKNLEKSASK
jgi:hypothetical protein